MRAIRRTKTIEGTSIPGFIHNGGQFFYINVDVYEDGMVNCWELVDLKGLQGKLDSGWLVPAVPAGEQIFIHGLGAYIVESAQWAFDEKSYYKHFKNTLASLNPDLTNIYAISSRERQRDEQRRIAHSPAATDFYVSSEQFYQTVEGASLHLFMKYGSENYLVNITVYKDGRVLIHNLPDEQEYTLEQLAELFADGTFFTEITTGTAIQMLNIGKVVLSDSLYSSDAGEKLKELYNLHKKLNGEQTAHEACRAAYHNYLENPIEFYREQLRIKYELVPEHERMYLGDMDTKDWDYRRIIYSPENKREV
ncbi:hypothetical protein [Paenibacillus sp. MMS20-IR301]|uniref:DUF7638 domain-containing protein n=1 Tax=Paenibacillus sp. MMS20-IR301 TaxID=2895946 RepID=UPI0028E7BD79|nr:hypothetical protein [Paenibacillus sp. MMS20-IR301]WNS44689.1 hypothetical protein LOS79_05285 [Paenibacillus sp. MMS20-IR301]